MEIANNFLQQNLRGEGVFTAKGCLLEKLGWLAGWLDLPSPGEGSHFLEKKPGWGAEETIKSFKHAYETGFESTLRSDSIIRNEKNIVFTY